MELQFSSQIKTKSRPYDTKNNKRFDIKAKL